MTKIAMYSIIAIISIFSIVLISLVIPDTVSAHNEEPIDAAYGTTPEIDGIISPGEWGDANFIQYTLDEGATATVYFKEDGENLYVAFDIPTPPHVDDDSGILFDPNHNGGSRPQWDDIVIQQRRDGSERREAKGTGIAWVYIPPRDWLEETSSTENGWSIEYCIYYSKLGLQPSSYWIFGIAFHILDNGKEYDWPINPCFNVPDSWADIDSSDSWGVEEDSRPSAHASADKTSGYAPLTVLFNGTGLAFDGTIASYRWDFDDESESFEQSPIHTFENPGTYDVKLTVTDDDGDTGNDTIKITVTDRSDDIDDKTKIDPIVHPDDDEYEKTGKDEERGLPGFEASAIIGAVLVAVLIFYKDRIYII
jgi:hypothetical protein